MENTILWQGALHGGDTLKWNLQGTVILARKCFDGTGAGRGWIEDEGGVGVTSLEGYLLAAKSACKCHANILREVTRVQYFVVLPHIVLYLYCFD